MNVRFGQLFIALLLLFSVSCKKDKAEDVSSQNGCRPVENIKNYFDFKIGSWWVYEEENSGMKDSVYVTEEWNDSNSCDFDVRYYSSVQGCYYHFWPDYAVVNGCSDNGTICKNCVNIKRSKYDPGNYVYEAQCFFYIPQKGDSFYQYNAYFPDNYIIVEEVYETFSLGAYVFEETYKIHELNTFMEGIQPTNHYYAENVGLVRKELLDSNQVWNLVNYHIVK